ncbi:hypothetical protein SteCoe_23498 [Stentor coeruleus]|uniref:Uncharacterized protein n=1 Tax=Stentor coeruleus TaxID=5963 RepID=A0A1R2BJT0_9CILI|nr:hypothetical protein SteCoe_23498 [Stentor coeruleus]
MNNLESRASSNKNRKSEIYVTNSIGVSRIQFCKFVKGKKHLSKKEMLNLLDLQSMELNDTTADTDSKPQKEQA